MLTFLYDRENSDERYAFDNLKDVVLFYQSEEERTAFEVYIEEHQGLVDDQLKTIDRYNYIHAENEHKTTVYRDRLRVGVALNKLLCEWQNEKNERYEHGKN
ncbi:hypothetical protein SDC9_164978 [bioreactor metagenome]|uniref:Uncharacterized protein n=1 Tax=bioreactor metagenome TaxID=1076179 RepID=A0A645G0D2_9ZZZZ